MCLPETDHVSGERGDLQQDDKPERIIKFADETDDDEVARHLRARDFTDESKKQLSYDPKSEPHSAELTQVRNAVPQQGLSTQFPPAMRSESQLSRPVRALNSFSSSLTDSGNISRPATRFTDTNGSRLSLSRVSTVHRAKPRSLSRPNRSVQPADAGQLFRPVTRRLVKGGWC